MNKNQYPPPTSLRTFGKFVMYLSNGGTYEEGLEESKHFFGLGTWTFIGSFKEEKVQRNEVRTELQKALDLCNKKKANLVVPKMSHLSQTTNFIEACLEYGCGTQKGPRVIGFDLLGSEHIPMGLLARMSITHRAKISKGLIAKNAELKKQGKKLGSPKLDKARAVAYERNRTRADDFAEKILPVIHDLQKKGFTTFTEIANELNRQEIPSRRGGVWYASSVRNITRREK